MIDQLQKLAAEAAALLKAFEVLEAERERVYERGQESTNVPEVRQLAAQLLSMQPEFLRFEDEALALDGRAEEIYAQVQEMIDGLRDQCVDPAYEVSSNASMAAASCEEDAETFVTWADDTDEESQAPEQLSRRRARMPLFRVG